MYMQIIKIFPTSFCTPNLIKCVSWTVFSPAGQVFSFNTKQLRNQVSTEEGSPNDDDSYLGYSVTTGSSLGTITWTSLWGCREEPTWAARWVELSSWLLDFFLQTCLQVVLYNTNLTNLHNLTGDQIGAYFGYTIATCDINGDGLDDILIGAPMWTDFTVMGKFETGRVYVVYQDKNVSLTDWPP